ncbi:hypothetical protein QUW13_00980 [Enterococcus hirae]|nr:hypothetical protein [Enterococcus hirae]
MELRKEQIIILNVVNNLPLAIAITTVAPALADIKIGLTGWLINVAIAFVVACLVNFVFPIPMIAERFPRIFHLDPKKFSGRLVANLPINLLFVLTIGLISNLYNVRAFPDFVFAFLATFLPIYVITFVLSMITNPIAQKLAFRELDSSEAK